MIKSRPLANELLRQLVFVAMIPILVTALYFSIELLPRLQKDIIDKQQSIAVLISQQTVARMHSSEGEIKMFASLNKNTQDRPIEPLFESFVSQSEIFDTIYLLDQDGTITNIAIKGMDSEQASRIYQQMDMSRTSIYNANVPIEAEGWSKVFLSVVSGRLSTAFVTRLNGKLLIAELAINRLPQLSQDLSKRGVLVMLLDGDQQLIAHPNPDLSQQQINLSNLELLSINSTESINSGDFIFRQERYFGSHVTMKELGWSVIIAENRDQINAELYNTVLFWLLAMLVILAVAIAFAFQRARVLNERFSVLNRQSKDVAEGRYNTEVKASNIKEFSELSENLSTMAEAIQKRETSLQNKENELRQLNLVLEKRVEERTEKLRSTNTTLQETVDALSNTMDQLVQSEKLASLGSLVAGISHELNTPIGNANIASTSLNDFAQSLRKQLSEGDVKRSDLDQFLSDTLMATEITERNLNRAAELITSFKQVAADQSSSKRREFSLSEVVHEILLTLQPQTKKRPISIETSIAADIYLDSFPGPLGQVLSNLIINAFIHGFERDEKGEITLRASEEESSVFIYVEDNGKGIDEHLIARVFDPFFTTKLGQGGSGLGLHICHNIVTEILGGKIVVMSKPNVGTTFTLKIPKIAPVSQQTSTQLP